MGLAAIICGLMLHCNTAVSDLSFRPATRPEIPLVITARDPSPVVVNAFVPVFHPYSPPFQADSGTMAPLTIMHSATLLMQMRTTVFPSPGFQTL